MAFKIVNHRYSILGKQAKSILCMTFFLKFFFTRHSLNILTFPSFELFRQHSEMSSLSQLAYKKLPGHSNLCAFISLKKFALFIF